MQIPQFTLRGADYHQHDVTDQVTTLIFEAMEIKAKLVERENEVAELRKALQKTFETKQKEVTELHQLRQELMEERHLRQMVELSQRSLGQFSQLETDLHGSTAKRISRQRVLELLQQCHQCTYQRRQDAPVVGRSFSCDGGDEIDFGLIPVAVEIVEDKGINLDDELRRQEARQNNQRRY